MIGWSAAILMCLMTVHQPCPGQWVRVGYPGTVINALLAHGDTVIAGSQDEVFHSYDAGTTWGPAGRLTTIAVSDLVAQDNELFASTSRARGCPPGECDPLASLFRSTDGGITWDSVWSAVYGAKNLEASPSALYANPDGALFRSGDRGRTWELVPVDTGALGLVELLFLFGDMTFIDTRSRGLHRSTGGSEWRESQSGLPGTAVFSMASQGSALFAVAAGFGIYQSADSGLSWTAMNEGLGEPEAIHTVQSGLNGLYAASSESVFVMPRGMSTWVNVTRDLTPAGFPFVSCLAEGGGNLFAGTNDGIWRADVSRLVTSAPDDITFVNEFRVHPNYPNPFNSGTVIAFEVPTRSRVRVTVASILGQHIATLLNRAIEAGSFSVAWDASGLPSGVYLYRITATRLAGPQITVEREGKMILMR